MGLLDSFFGNADQTTALGLLGAHMMAGNAPAGYEAALGLLDKAPDRAMERQYKQAQMQNLASEIEARKLATIKDQRQQKLMESFFPGLSLGDSQAPAVPGAPAQFSGAAPSFGTPPSTQPSAPAGGSPASGGNDILGLAQKLGIPPQAIQADIVFNGGKKISELIAKQGTPDMQVTNGYAYDKNRIGPGYLPQLNISQDGKASMVQIGPDGLPVVSAPSGAVPTYAGYRNIDESAKANFDPITVTPQGQNPQMTTRGALVRNPQLQGPPPGADADRAAILGQELTKAQAQLKAALQAGDQEAAGRAATDVSALNRELGRAGGASRATVGMPLQSKAEDVTAEATARADVERATVTKADAKRYGQMRAGLDRAVDLLNAGPTESGLGSLIDSGANFIGQSTRGADLASQLSTLSGWLTANTPRMEGPQSNADVQQYAIMAGTVGDKTKPVSQRLAAAQEVRKLQDKYAELNGYAFSQPAKAAQAEQPKQVIDTLPKTAPKGQRVRDTATGKILQFNGLSWVEAK